VWLARTKCSAYSVSDLEGFARISADVLKATLNGGEAWIPPIHEIEKWWDAETLNLLGRCMARIRILPGSTPMTDLVRIVFCRVMIEAANVSFGHQSMSFKAPPEPALFHDKRSDFEASWTRATRDVTDAARSPIVSEVRVLLNDARCADDKLVPSHYDLVITSPPYPNRMSYIRELRPYMYWLGFLTSGRQAGELDWEAIGGTWGCATSNLQKWAANGSGNIPFPEFGIIVQNIRARSDVLGIYVQKYFHDMWQHVRSLERVVKPGGHVNYIVGNSKFYDVLLPVEQVFVEMFRKAGFASVTVRTLRKRTSKKELYEYLVSAIKPE